MTLLSQIKVCEYAFAWGLCYTPILYMTLASQNKLIQQVGITVTEILIVLTFVMILSAILDFQKGLFVCWCIMGLFVMSTLVVILVQLLLQRGAIKK